jgi:predicted signal transduction protein with EAL and GGDEF domain
LRNPGCKFSLDNFGSVLFHVPQASCDIATDRIDAAMVKAIHGTGQVMGLETIAEFVENGAILERLRALGVNYAQGYGIHVPQPLETILATHRRASGLLTDDTQPGACRPNTGE